MQAVLQRIVARAREFDLRALMGVLNANGFDEESIQFQSNADGASPRSLVESIEFSEADKLATVTLNIGLLGSRTLLPSYFLQAVQSASASYGGKRDPQDVFADFIRFFDGRLLSEVVAAVRPESNTAVFRDWAQSQSDATDVAGLACPLALHALATGLFPEFEVRVQHARLAEATSAHGAMIGGSRLHGSAVLGGVYNTQPDGFAIDLVIEEEVDEYRRDWVNTARARLTQTLLPRLAEHQLGLIIRLTVLAHDRWAHVDGPAESESDQGDLGSERIRGQEGEHTIVLYRGHTGRGSTRALHDRVHAFFPGFEVHVRALATFEPGYGAADEVWPAGFSITLVTDTVPSGLRAGDRPLRELVKERFVRELRPELASLRVPLVVGLELRPTAVRYPETALVFRGFAGEELL